MCHSFYVERFTHFQWVERLQHFPQYKFMRKDKWGTYKVWLRVFIPHTWCFFSGATDYSISFSAITLPASSQFASEYSCHPFPVTSLLCLLLRWRQCKRTQLETAVLLNVSQWHFLRSIHPSTFPQRTLLQRKGNLRIKAELVVDIFDE